MEFERDQGFITGYYQATVDMVERITSMPKRLGGEIIFNRDSYFKDFKQFAMELSDRCVEKLEEHYPEEEK